MIAPFVCPSCREPLTGSRCAACGGEYAAVDGVPILLAGTSASATQQAAFFDETVDREFEIERPECAPAFYAWLLRQKFRRAVAGIPVRGRTALVVCGGSGMDAEFLASAGAQVASSDISLGAAKRALERAARHGVPLVSLVANVERLPFPDKSVDIVYVHDGLHHLERPLAGLEEMARVARLAVCVTEPARAAATAAAARVGLAQNVEEAGNRVARLTVEELTGTLERHGFQIVNARRYAMLYRHEPGLAMRLLSLPGLFQAARAGLWLADALVGRAGNKAVVSAIAVSA